MPAGAHAGGHDPLMHPACTSSKAHAAKAKRIPQPAITPSSDSCAPSVPVLGWSRGDTRRLQNRPRDGGKADEGCTIQGSSAARCLADPEGQGRENKDDARREETSEEVERAHDRGKGNGNRCGGGRDQQRGRQPGLRATLLPRRPEGQNGLPHRVQREDEADQQHPHHGDVCENDVEALRREVLQHISVDLAAECNVAARRN
mmetsp:Transcript_38921/g.122650  ORF Transcript_38921/g.122650 Transcript_38921/m.122650 type:complete len:203 (-) Transcript_38921:796-1404(-)